jgi:hypothetical protein
MAVVPMAYEPGFWLDLSGLFSLSAVLGKSAECEGNVIGVVELEVNVGVARIEEVGSTICGSRVSAGVVVTTYPSQCYRVEGR